ncbi:hypothetical protein M422DRAFT_243676 [Sphaerobolus stellatus SS14]|nr:hypothetical protein M422DRAFT_243676 [Sphaerobolus stellatus SS14]
MAVAEAPRQTHEAKRQATETLRTSFQTPPLRSLKAISIPVAPVLALYKAVAEIPEASGEARLFHGEEATTGKELCLYMDHPDDGSPTDKQDRPTHSISRSQSNTDRKKSQMGQGACVVRLRSPRYLQRANNEPHIIGIQGPRLAGHFQCIHAFVVVDRFRPNPQTHRHHFIEGASTRLFTLVQRRRRCAIIIHVKSALPHPLEWYLCRPTLPKSFSIPVVDHPANTSAAAVHLQAYRLAMSFQQGNVSPNINGKQEAVVPFKTASIVYSLNEVDPTLRPLSLVEADVPTLVETFQDGRSIVLANAWLTLSNCLECCSGTPQTPPRSSSRRSFLHMSSLIRILAQDYFV